MHRVDLQEGSKLILLHDRHFPYFSAKTKREEKKMGLVLSPFCDV
jgi:hypothetical protein